MRVIASARGFIHSHLKEVGVSFEIPDEPRRRLTKTDDEVTRSVADGRGTVPVAFTSNWMRPAPAESADEAPAADETKSEGTKDTGAVI